MTAARLASPTTTVTSADGTRIAVDVVGSGPTLVLVGGASTVRRRKGLVRLAEALAEDFTVVTYDRRGRGDSEAGPASSVEAEVDDLAAVVEHAGGPAHLVGMASGGVLALRAVGAGIPVRGITVYQPPHAQRQTLPGQAHNVSISVLADILRERAR